MAIKIGKKERITKPEFPESADIKIKFGKYKNKTLKHIYNKDVKYFEWLEGLDNLYSNYRDAIEDIRIYEQEIEDYNTEKVLKKIDKLVKEKNIVYFVNVHSVGSEFRLGSYKDGVWIEDIMDRDFSLNGSEISKKNYKVLEEKMRKICEEQGWNTQDRGLY